MKRYFQVFVLLFFISLPGFSQFGPCEVELIPKYDSRKKMWGFSNLMGHWEIRPFYTKVSPFVENKAVVMKGLDYGVINCQGNVIVPPKYDQITNFRNGKAWVKDDGKWGLVDYMGRMVFSPLFTEIFPIEHTELTWVVENGVWGLFNEDSRRMMCKPQFKIAKVLSPNSSMVQVDSGYFGVVNHVNCRFLIEPKITHVKKVNISTVLFQIDNKWGIFSYDGRIRANADYDSIRPGTTSLLIFKKDNQEGLMDLEGKVVQDAKFEKIGEYNDGLFTVLKDGKYGYINLLGKVYIKPQYDEASAFQDKQAVVKIEGKAGVIDIKKNFVLEPEYVSISRSSKHPYYVVSQKQNDSVKKYLYNIEGEKVSEGFDEIMISDTSEIIRVKDAGKVFFWSLSSQTPAFDKQFQDAKPFSKGYAFIKQDGKWGAVNERWEIVVQPKFDDINCFWFTNRLVFKTEKEGQQGIVSTDGVTILPASFEEIVPSTLNYLKVKKAGKYGVYKTDGSVVFEPVYDFMTNAVNSPKVPEWPAIVVKDNDYGLLDERHGEVISPSESNIFYSGEDIYIVKERRKFQAVNSRGEELRKVDYDSIGYTGDGRIAVFNGKKWGYVSKEGEKEIDFEFEEAKRYINRIAIVKQGGKYGLINFNGEFVKKAVYDSWIEENDKRYLIKGNDKVSVDD